MATCRTLNMTAFEKTKQAVAQDPEVGKGEFEAVTAWQDGALATTTARTFVIRTDEPQPLGGGDTAVDPMELLLASLGSCLTIGWVTQANLRGVDFRNLKIRVRAPYDLRGYLGLDDRVRRGFSRLEYTVEVDTDAEQATLEEIRTAAERTSPMFDNIRNGAPIVGSLKCAGGGQRAA